MAAAKCIAVAAVLSTASAFMPAMPSTLISTRHANVANKMTMMAEKSASIPFMPKPTNLPGDGSIVGDVGFDPLGFTDFVDVRFMQEAEIKHGRITMLAVVGWIATDLGLRLPGDIHQVSSVEAHDAAVAWGGMSQILLWVIIAEAISTVAVVQMLEGSGRAPGSFGFDPLKLKDNAAKKADMELKEITNGRLAMLAFGGLCTQAVLYGKGFPYF